jgi:hypothetical protein
MSKESFLPGAHLGEGSIAFKSVGHSQGEKTMAKLDKKRREELKSERVDVQAIMEGCKVRMDAIDKELAADPEDGAAKSLEFHSPDMKAAIQEARQQPAFKSASLALR